MRINQTWTPDQPLSPHFTNYEVWQRLRFLADDGGTEPVTVAFEAREAGMKLAALDAATRRNEPQGMQKVTPCS